MRNALRGGRRAGRITACGTLSGLLAWVLAAALGLSALLRVSHLGYDILRLAGAACLIWLGVSSLGLARRRRSTPGTAASPGTDAGPTARERLFLSGLVSNLCNPKDRLLLRRVPAGLHPPGLPQCRSLSSWGSGLPPKPARGLPFSPGWSPAGRAGCGGPACSGQPNASPALRSSASACGWLPGDDGPDVTRSRERRWRANLADPRRAAYIAADAADAAGALLGFAQIGGCRDEDVDGDVTGELMALHVGEPCWRHGIGSALHAQAQTALAARGFTDSTLWVLTGNARARSFYAAHDWTADGRARHRVLRGADVHEVRYVSGLPLGQIAP
jgi:GNAT superfamily N-acetyltransferase